ncbi:secondary thiamine-phosphate synthase enzyme YjbQ [Chitinispirillales bacterium ANBcel5]|uniref:secondary thiamine-phosphate synthase enzyme YjbQ n=1 Tax=Cellulosispirillum alkaliphilum TaxID=3039283 RepID=UPI002A579D10|nr:secondary thiamine-phosphate synthase enzyme YjbQ [Chitinispirillales bacterium ANBcel5]
MVHYEEHGISTQKRTEWLDITSQVEKSIRLSNVQNGICMVSSLHTTAAITLNENADPDVGRDFFYKMNQLITKDPAFNHIEGNSDSHIKSSLVGFSAQVPVLKGKLVLGTWQSLYFCEFDGPRSGRKFSVTIIGE